MHAVYEEVVEVLYGEPYSCPGRKRIFTEFFSACRSLAKRHREPFQREPNLQTGYGVYRAYQCSRFLALIELVDVPFWKLPFNHSRLCDMIWSRRKQEQSNCETVSEIMEAAIDRLVAFTENPTHAHFLNIRGADMDRRAESRKIVRKLAEAFEKQKVDIIDFKPNQFACLSAYHKMFLRRSGIRPSNGLNRWVYFLRGYVPGKDIEKDGAKKECLASQCLPRHYDDSGVIQPASQNVSGRAIAAPPVTCELCHKGFAGMDKFQSHCVKEHCGLAEYRKRLFYRAKQTGPCELQPWVKRNMVQSFQFFRLHSVPSSVNDYTYKAITEAEPRREEACAVVKCEAFSESSKRLVNGCVHQTFVHMRRDNIPQVSF